MTTLVVFDTNYGNTEILAESIVSQLTDARAARWADSFLPDAAGSGT